MWPCAIPSDFLPIRKPWEKGKKKNMIIKFIYLFIYLHSICVMEWESPIQLQYLKDPTPYIHTYIYTPYIHIYKYTCIYIYIYIYISYIHIHKYTCRYIYTPYIHIHKYTCVCVYIYIYIYIYTIYIHIYTIITHRHTQHAYTFYISVL